MVRLTVEGWAAVVGATVAVVTLILAVAREMDRRQEEEHTRIKKRMRDAEVRGYFKRQDEIKDRVLGLLDTALAFCGPEQGEIRRLLTSVQQSITRVSMKESDDDGT